MTDELRKDELPSRGNVKEELPPRGNVKAEVQHILSVLGTEGILDTLLCVRELDWTTASEVAGHMNTHVATAVKRLTGLYEIGILDRRVRKGKTRSAQEYSLLSTSFGLDIDLDELAGSKPVTSNSEVYLQLLNDMALRFGKFSGKPVKDIITSWGIEDIDNAGKEEIIQKISDILELETEEYGNLTVRSLAAASLDAVGSQKLNNLPSKFFGVE